MPGTLVGAGMSRDANLTNKVLTPLQLTFSWGVRMMTGEKKEASLGRGKCMRD